MMQFDQFTAVHIQFAGVIVAQGFCATFVQQLQTTPAGAQPARPSSVRTQANAGHSVVTNTQFDDLDRCANRSAVGGDWLRYGP